MESVGQLMKNGVVSRFETIKASYSTQNPFTPLLKQRSNLEGKPLILYGCGILCSTVISVFKDFGLPVTAVSDSYKTGIYQDTGSQIIPPDRLKEEYPDANIVICSFQYADGIKSRLNSLGFTDAHIFMASHASIRFMHPSVFEREYLKGYEWAYDFFKDDISKRILEDRISMYLVGTYMTKTSAVPIYFDPEFIALKDHEVFIDGGAYIGDTAEAFIKQMHKCGKEYSHIYSFEPDSAALIKAVQNLRQYTNADVIGKGLWSCEDELKFFSDGGHASSTFIGGLRTVTVPVTSLDSYFAKKPDEVLPTYIKMDIEGAEKEALKGSADVILRKHPKLAVCAYHKPEDVYVLPKLIHEIDPSYRFALRQCADGPYDTVLYAV
jgi:FkbM family methyltransferase